ncbi:unnamed protein product [Polarella glacialis]|uniref:Uncharacterized protein n=1 Tax=Polarella glacialis TaxID=89957 RepID=A0A813D8G8_POLGL|nr:unnamed protein product [Polarella glacialis]
MKLHWAELFGAIFVKHRRLGHSGDVKKFHHHCIGTSRRAAAEFVAGLRSPELRADLQHHILAMQLALRHFASPVWQVELTPCHSARLAEALPLIGELPWLTLWRTNNHVPKHENNNNNNNNMNNNNNKNNRKQQIRLAS